MADGIGFDVRQDVREVERMFSGLAKKQTPFATANAINTLLFASLAAEKREMERVFDRPTRYTLNSLRVRKAKKTDLAGRMWVKSKLDAGKGTSPENYLLPNIEGGPRKAKRFEVALRRIGVLPEGWLSVPGEGATLDAYGNMSRAQIVQLLSWFHAFGEQGYRANITEKTKARLKRGTKRKYGISYYAAIPGREKTRKLTPGIYKRIRTGFGTATVPVLIFIRRANYQAKRFDFEGIADRYVRAHFRAEFEKQMRRAIATAR